MSSKPHDIVILGSSFAGLRIAHVLLSDVIPNLPPNVSGSTRLFRVVFVSPSDRFYMNISSLRAVTRPQLIDDEKLLPEFLPHFEKYQAIAPVEHIQGYVTSLDAKQRIVIVKRVDGTMASEESVKVHYDSLIIATGSSTATPAFKNWPTATSNDIKTGLRNLSAKIKVASTIAIGGGGSTAVELSSDLREEYPSKKVVVYAGHTGIVSEFPAAQRKVITDRLVNKFGVTVVNKRVTGVEENSTTGKYEITVSAADESPATVESADLYISAVGLTPNTAFLPPEVLDARGYVLSDEHLRVTGLSSRVYVTGDASALSDGSLVSLRTHTGALKETLALELALATETTNTTSSNLSDSVADESAFIYAVPKLESPPKTFIVTLGSTGGVGMINGYCVPNIIVRLLKARNASLSGSPIMVEGSPLSLKVFVSQVKKGDWLKS